MKDLEMLALGAAAAALLYWYMTRNANAASAAPAAAVLPRTSSATGTAAVYTDQPLNQSVLAYFYRDGM